MVGSALPAPEKGWKRYDDRNEFIKYNGTYGQSGDTNSGISNVGSNIQFKFRGSKLRILSNYSPYRSYNILIDIDGIEYRYKSYSSATQIQTVLYQKLDLDNIS
ncbi:hypothetical protein [Clostridium saccharoperbutylacetonicum]|uniref:hypothetical protein n=1 Tax=Clostridium saccharoperbutylacetonicum TaxID=36745 RepID=UPI000983D6E3|nr:hypothetical protein [Clostridium saccharoperbutylacetonicum]AQR95615.1 hypothetical protein CLSAP_29310 [Clostridium saccharoperbutylacetonicum]NSB31476.1 hypothetical protein [Clostridium saccharoperbutylacetonicum]